MDGCRAPPDDSRTRRGPFLEALEFLLGLSLVFAVVFELVALA